MRHVADPVLDGADGRHFLAQLEQRVLRIALPRRQRILERDQRQVGDIGDALEMRQRHGRRLAERERRRRKHQKRGGAALRRHLGDARGFEAAVGPDAANDRQLGADLVQRDFQHAALLVERTGGDLGGMRVDRDGGEAFDRCHVTQMPAEIRLVDRQIVLERQQQRRDDAVGDVVCVPWHGFLRFLFIPGRPEGPDPESILRSAGVMDSGFAGFARAPE